MDSTICPNCESKVNQHYCSNCGQKKVEGRLKWTEIWDEFRDKVVGIEKGLLHTFLMMIKKPGKPALDYVNGIRKKHASPIQYYFLGITLIFLAFEFFDVVAHIGDNEWFQEIATANNYDDKKREFLNLYFTAFSKNLKTLTFIAFPFQLFFVYLFFRKYRFSLLECAVALLYLEGTTSIIQVFTAPLYKLLGVEVMSAFSFVIIIYSMITLKRFFNSGWFRAIIAYAFYYIILILSISVGTIVIMFVGKWLF
jgi:hypothetical protein